MTTYRIGTLTRCCVVLLLSVLCCAQANQFVTVPVITVYVMDDTRRASGRFHGYLEVTGPGQLIGGQLVGASGVGKIPILQEPEMVNLPLPLYPLGSHQTLSARFYSNDEDAPKVPIRCSVSFVAGKDGLLFLHFLQTSTGYGCNAHL